MASQSFFRLRVNLEISNQVYLFDSSSRLDGLGILQVHVAGDPSDREEVGWFVIDFALDVLPQVGMITAIFPVRVGVDYALELSHYSLAIAYDVSGFRRRYDDMVDGLQLGAIDRLDPSGHMSRAVPGMIDCVMDPHPTRRLLGPSGSHADPSVYAETLASSSLYKRAWMVAGIALGLRFGSSCLEFLGGIEADPRTK